jgi:hypothetical protein
MSTSLHCFGKVDTWSTLLFLCSAKTNLLRSASKIIYYSCYSEDEHKTVRVSEKAYNASKMMRMDNSRSHSRSFGFGDFEQTQSTAVFFP